MKMKIISIRVGLYSNFGVPMENTGGLRSMATDRMDVDGSILGDSLGGTNVFVGDHLFEGTLPVKMFYKQVKEKF